MNKETFEKKLAAEIESKRKSTPKISDKNESCICTPFAIDINPNCKAQTHKL